MENLSNPTRGASSFSSLAPLHSAVFRALWIATIASNLGTWMQDLVESWLMVSLTQSPILVALVETAGSLPVVLLALPAGAFADLIDRRKLLLVTQIWMLVAAAVMGALTFAGIMTPSLLLLLTFSLGVGSAMNSPAWQAIVPELVPRRELSQAMTLSSVAFNVSRAVGPAVGGLIVAAASPGGVFLLNAVSFLGVIVVIYRWDRAGEKRRISPEHIWGAMRAGIRYARHAPETEKEARAQGRSVRVAKLSMANVARAIEFGETRGFMKAIVDADTNQILGCAILGMEGGEVMTVLQVAMMGKLPYTVIRDVVFAHPTLAESLNNLFMSMDGQGLHEKK